MEMETAMNNIKTLKELLEYACDTYEDKTYIRYNTKEGIVDKSFLQIKKDSYAIGRFLKNAFGNDVKRVAIIGNASYEYIASYFGIVCSGNIVVQVDANVSPDKLCKLLESAKVDVVFYDKKLSQRVLYIKRKCNSISLFVCQDDDDNNELNSLKSHIRYNIGDLDTVLNPDDYSVISEEITQDDQIMEKKLTNKMIITNIMKQKIRLSNSDILLCLMPIHIAECFNANVVLAMKQGAVICFQTSRVSMIEDIKRYKPTKLEMDSIIAKKLLTILQRNELQKERLDNIYSVNDLINPSIIEEYKKYGIETNEVDKLDFIKE